MYVNGDNMGAYNDATYFDNVAVEHIPKKLRRLQATEILQHISRVQAYDSVMCGYFCIGLIDFILKGKVC